jgi:hypothetical protein
MMGDVAGSIRKVILDGVTYDVPGDVNITEIGGAYENESIPSSGRNMKKMTKRSENREGVVLLCNGGERELLKELSERTTDFPMSYETAGGDTYTAVGWIEFENRETEENRATVQLHPRGKWDSFLAN